MASYADYVYQVIPGLEWLGEMDPWDAAALAYGDARAEGLSQHSAYALIQDQAGTRLADHAAAHFRSSPRYGENLYPRLRSGETYRTEALWEAGP